MNHQFESVITGVWYCTPHSSTEPQYKTRSENGDRSLHTLVCLLNIYNPKQKIFPTPIENLSLYYQKVEVAEIESLPKVRGMADKEIVG